MRDWEIKFGLDFDPVRFERSVWCQLSFSLFNWVVSEPEAIFQFDGKHQSYHDRTKFKHVHKHVLTSTLSSPICPLPLNMSDLINSVNLKLISLQVNPELENEWGWMILPLSCTFWFWLHSTFRIDCTASTTVLSVVYHCMIYVAYCGQLQYEK